VAKTKAALIAENKALKVQVKERDAKIEKLERQNQARLGVMTGSMPLIAAAKAKVVEADRAVQQLISRTRKGATANKAKAAEKRADLIREYDDYVHLGLEHHAAMKKANQEVADKYGRGYGRTKLNKTVNEHLAKTKT
jgi:ribosomal protein L17